MAINSLAQVILGWDYLYHALAAILVLGYAIHKYVEIQRLSTFKGPFWAKWSELWIARMTLQSRIHVGLRELSEEYGSIARAGPNLLITTDVELLRKIAAPRSRYNRSEWNQAMKLDNRIDNILSELDEKRHAELRYKTSFGYNGKDLPSRETRVADRVLDYVKLIEDSYLSTAEHVKPMDLARTAQYFTLDVITDMAFGYPFGFLSANKDLYDYISSVGSLMPFFELQGNVRFVAAITQNYYVKALMSPKANDGSPFGQMIGAAQQAVKERYRPGAEQKEDMLTSFMKRGITQLEAESEALMQVLAGADSTATAVRMIMFHLMSTPYTYQKLQAEIDDAQLTWPVNTDTEAKSLPYLQAVIKEGLRIWPPGVGIATKYVPPEGETLDDGRFIPGGTRIGWSAWGVHHNPETYGEDAKYFRPERWIDNDPDKIRRMENVLDSIFGNGRYGCVGRSLAILELNKILIAFLQRFDFAILDPTVPFKSACNGFFVQSDMFVRVTKRKL